MIICSNLIFDKQTSLQNAIYQKPEYQLVVRGEITLEYSVNSVVCDNSSAKWRDSSVKGLLYANMPMDKKY